VRLSSLRSTRLTGARCAAISWRFTTSSCRSFSASLVGVSVDGVWYHLAYSKDRQLRFPLLAGFEPKGEVARSYGVYRPHDGITERAIFVIDADGTIRWSYVSPIGVNPGADGILTALKALPVRQEMTV